IARESLRASVAENLAPAYAEEIESHFEYMPDHYFRATGVPDLIQQVKLLRSFLVNGFSGREFPLTPAVEWNVRHEPGHAVVTFGTWERERLLAKIAGSFSVVRLNILSADVFPRGDNTVLGVFRVCDPRAQPVSNQRDFELVAQTLRRALED